MSDSIIDIYKDLFGVSDVLGVLCKYIAQSKCGFTYDFGTTIIPKGTRLYRVRQYSKSTDFSNPSEWLPAPNKPQNRCNRAGESALYLGSTEPICLFELHIKCGEQYALAEYEVTKDIEVGGFLYVSPNESKWKIYAARLFNAFLIAPSRNEANKELFKVLDNYFDDTDYSKIGLSALTTPGDEFRLPWRLGRINQRDEYYSLTNKICDILKRKAPNGIRYSSCFFPIETVGIQCSAYNICLYESGIKDVKFVSSTIKTNTKDFNLVELANFLLKGKEN